MTIANPDFCSVTYQVASPESQPVRDKVGVVAVLDPVGDALPLYGVQLDGGVASGGAARPLPRGRVLCAEELILEALEF